MSTSAPTDDVKGLTREFLCKFIRTQELQDGDDYFASGLVNSLFAMQLVMFVEKEFAITVENDDLDLSNFRTIEAISDFVGRKQAAKADA
jgi:acyl carrier protein